MNSAVQTTDSTNDYFPPQLVSASLTRRNTGDFGSIPIDVELGIRLEAILSFLGLEFQPKNDETQKKAQVRDWSNELHVLSWSLSRCNSLILRAAVQSAARSANERAAAEETAALNLLAQSISDSVALCSRLADAVNFGEKEWTSWSRLLQNELLRTEIVLTLQKKARDYALRTMPAEITAMIERKQIPLPFAVVLEKLFTLLSHLHFVGRLMENDLPLKPTLPVFTLVNKEACAMLEYIQSRVLRTLNEEDPIFDALDGTSYIISMELKKVFTHELIDACAMRQAPALCAKIETAFGLLNDCFQHSTIGLLQIFAPQIQSSELFPNFKTKLEQSIVLREDLWKILNFVKSLESASEPIASAEIHTKFNNFRRGGMRYLMYKDWDTCDRFIEELSFMHNPSEIVSTFHRFGAYLETLLGQVNMRSVLAGHPFEYPADSSAN